MCFRAGYTDDVIVLEFRNRISLHRNTYVNNVPI